MVNHHISPKGHYDESTIFETALQVQNDRRNPKQDCGGFVFDKIIYYHALFDR